VQKLSFKFDISEEGKVAKVHQKQYFNDFMKQFAGKSVKVTVEKWKKQRSLNQNNYYWGCVLPCVIDGMVGVGYPRSVLSTILVHDFLKAKFVKKEVVNKQTGEVISMIGSTSELSTTNMIDYIDDIKTWASEFLGIYIPDPNEQSTLNFD
jgi:hypothetical protein